MGKERCMAKEQGDVKKIQDLLKLMKDNDLVEMEIVHGEDRISLKRAQAQMPMVTGIPMPTPMVPAAPAAPSAESAPAEDDLIDITSPIVGTFYEAPSPDSDPYVKTGSAVDAQSVVCIVEAMKVMNEIKAEVNGTIQRVMVKNGEAVEFGQVLFKVKPN